MATPPDFTAGQVLEANAHMNKVGLWLIKTQATGSAQSSVVVSDVFSADYENYRIIVSGGSASGNIGLNMTLGATTTGYYYGHHHVTWAGTGVAQGGANATSWSAIGLGTSTALSMIADVSLPFATARTLINASSVYTDTTAATGFARWTNGFLDNATSYTAFTLTTSSGTVTGGTVYVYGWRD